MNKKFLWLIFFCVALYSMRYGAAWLLSPFLMGLVVLIPVAVWLVLLYRALRSHAQTSHEFAFVALGDLEWVDQDELQRVTGQFRELGFLPLCDISLIQRIPTGGASGSGESAPQTTVSQLPPIAHPTDPVTTSPDMGARPEVHAAVRVFHHPTQPIIGMVMAARGTRAGAQVSSLPLKANFLSVWAQGQDYWTFATSNHHPERYAVLNNHDSALWQRNPEADVAGLHQRHLALLPAVAGYIDLPVLTIRSPQDYVAYEEMVLLKLKSIYGRMSPVEAAFKLATFDLRRQDHYWGALAGKLPLPSAD